jgi:hypothetical protein
MKAAAAAASAGVTVGVVLVLLVAVTGHPGWGFFSHTECRLGQPVGNVTVWRPGAVVASPYRGSESGSVLGSAEKPWGYFNESQPTFVTDGNVTMYYLGPTNWTVFSIHNVSVLGLGPDSPCDSPLIGFHSPQPAQGVTVGGAASWPLFSRLMSDSGLPTVLNASELCAAIENLSNGHCAVGAQFDLNFQRATGVVNTCGLSQPQVLRLTSDSWPLRAPFVDNGTTFSVPLDDNAWGGSPEYLNQTFEWYNYTFPANTGTWQYDDLSQTSSTGSGLVFSYSPCL